jgi:hypothetical protein
MSEPSAEPDVETDVDDDACPGSAHDPGRASDELANRLERVAYKIHDWSNWLLGFVR